MHWWNCHTDELQEIGDISAIDRSQRLSIGSSAFGLAELGVFSWYITKGFTSLSQGWMLGQTQK